MNGTWHLDRPQTQEYGGPGEPVESVNVVLVSGRLDIVAHAGRSSVRCDVAEVLGRPLTVSSTDGALRIEHHKEAGGGQLLEMVKGFLANSRNATARITLTVPVGTRVSVNTVGADVLVGGVDGDAQVNTVSGAVSLSRLGGRVDVKTVSSAIEASGLRGELKSKSVSGRLTVDASALRSAKLGTVSGPILLDLVGGSGLVTATGVSGDITVRLPQGAGYDVTAGSQTGHVVVDGHTLSGGSGSDKGGHRADGDRSFAMKLRSVSGNVVVLRDGAGGQQAASPFLAGDSAGDVQDVLPGDSGGQRPGAQTAGDALWPQTPQSGPESGGATGGLWTEHGERPEDDQEGGHGGTR